MLDTTSPKVAESYFPTAGEIVGNNDITSELASRRKRQQPKEECNLLILGDPMTGKTATIIAHLRETLGDVSLLYGCQNDFDFLPCDGAIRKFMRIDGGSVARPHLENLVQSCIDPGDPRDHTFALLDNADEAFERELDEPLSPLLDHPQVTTYGTARSFQGKKTGDANRERTDRRLRGFLSRFRVRRRTQNPEPEELELFLFHRMNAWGMDHDSPHTVRLLVRKSNCVVGFALGALIEALGQNGGRLTYELVARYDPDPLKF